VALRLVFRFEDINLVYVDHPIIIVFVEVQLT
jgi:hypothetical protein